MSNEFWVTQRMQLLQVLNEAEILAEQGVNDCLAADPVGSAGWDKVTMFAQLGAMISRASNLVLRLQLQGDPVIKQYNHDCDLDCPEHRYKFDTDVGLYWKCRVCGHAKPLDKTDPEYRLLQGRHPTSVMPAGWTG